MSSGMTSFSELSYISAFSLVEHLYNNNNNNNNNIHLFKHDAWVPKLKAYGVVRTNDINQIILNEMQVF